METQKFCPKCGQPNDADNKFCSRCGTPLDGSQPDYTNPEAHPYYSQYEESQKSVTTSSDTASLVCGILSILLVNLILAIVAIVLGKKRRRENSYAKSGYVCGIVGLALSIVAIAAIVIWLVVFVILASGAVNPL